MGNEELSQPPPDTNTSNNDIIDLTKSRLQSETDDIQGGGEGLFSPPSDMGPTWSLLNSLLTTETSPFTCDEGRARTPPQEPSLPTSSLGCQGNIAPRSGAGERWAVPTTRTLITELDHDGQTQPIIVEELEETSGDSGERARVTVLDDGDAYIQVADVAISAYTSKPESTLSREEKIWRLAEKAGSTLSEDRLELDDDTKRRVKDGLKAAGLIDKVSLAF